MNEFVGKKKYQCLKTIFIIIIVMVIATVSLLVLFAIAGPGILKELQKAISDIILGGIK